MALSYKGCGTMLLHIRQRNEQAEAFATMWITVFYMPLIPLKRYYVQFVSGDAANYSYRILRKTRLSILEVLQAYWLGWIFNPLTLIAPFFPMIWIEEMGWPEAVRITAGCLGFFVFAVRGLQLGIRFAQNREPVKKEI